MIGLVQLIFELDFYLFSLSKATAMDKRVTEGPPVSLERVALASRLPSSR